MNELISGTQTMPGTLILLLKTVEGARWRTMGLEKVRALRGCRHGADVVSAGETVAVGGDKSVGGFANRTGKEAEHRGQQPPGLGQGTQAGEDGVGADEQVFYGRAYFAKDEDSVDGAFGAGATEVSRIACGGVTVACQDLGNDGVAGGCKTQSISVISLEQPANRPVTESALAVENDQQAIL
jgi:hypothetical protein